MLNTGFMTVTSGGVSELRARSLSAAGLHPAKPRTKGRASFKNSIGTICCRYIYRPPDKCSRYNVPRQQYFISGASRELESNGRELHRTTRTLKT